MTEDIRHDVIEEGVMREAKLRCETRQEFFIRMTGEPDAELVVKGVRTEKVTFDAKGLEIDAESSEG